MAGIGKDIDLNRPRLENEDGSFSTEETITLDRDGKWYNVPTIINGERVDPQEVEERFFNRDPSIVDVGEFETVEDAVSAAQARTEQIGVVRNNGNQSSIKETTLDTSTLSTERKEEIRRSQNQLGMLENLELGFKQTALSAGNDIIQDEAPALFKPRVTDLVDKLDVPDAIRAPLKIKALEFDAGFAGVMALAGDRGGTDNQYMQNKDEYVEELISGIPRKYHNDILEENSLEAAQRVKARIQDSLEDQELTSLQNDGTVTRLAGSLIDVDAPLALMSGGSYGAAKAALVGSRAAKVVGLSEKGAKRLAGFTQGVSGGAQAGALVGGLDAHWRETSDGLDFVYSTLGGAALGGTFGTMFGASSPELKTALTDTLDDFEARVATDDPSLSAGYDVAAMPTKSWISAADKVDDLGGSSVGAAQITATPQFQPKVINDPAGKLSETSNDIIQKAHQSNHDSGFYDRKAEDLGTWWEKIGNSSWSKASGTSFASKMYRSDSAVMNWLGRTVFESPNGFNRGTATSSALMENYHKRVQTQLQPYRTGMQSWAKRNGHTFLNIGHGVSHDGKAAFNRAIMLERNARMQGRARSTDRDIALAADALDNAAVEAHKIAQGRDGEPSIDGFEGVPVNPHYTPYNWSGPKIANLIAKAANPAAIRSALIKGLAQSYRDAGMAAGKDADAVANAVIRRAQMNSEEIQTSVIALLQKDGQDFLRSALDDAGTPRAEVDAIMKRLVGAQKDRSKLGLAKSKNEVDMETSITLPDGEQIQIVDLLSNNLDGDWQRYTRSLSGSAALARQGITNRAQRSEIISAIHAEQRSLGEELTPRQEIEAMFTAFDGTATKGWAASLGGEVAEQGRLIATSKRMVQLAWMNKLGLTQLGETSAIMAQNGLYNWAVRGPMAIFNKELKARNQALLDDMAYVTGDIGMDHHFYAPHQNLDEVSVLDRADFQSKVQAGLSDAVYVQGFTSAFNQVRAFQQKTAALGMADKVMRILNKDINLSLGVVNKVNELDINSNALPEVQSIVRKQEFDKLDEIVTPNVKSQIMKIVSDDKVSLGKTDFDRLRDIGISDEMVTRIQNLIEAGTIEFKTGNNGSVYVNRLNIDKWDGDLADEFGAAITRNINQVVQKSMAGESDAWMHTGWGSIITHLKTFPMQATQKQMVRHFRHNDPEAYAAVGYGLATAMIVSMVKEAIDLDKTRDMDTKDHAKRAFAYSNMTGFIPMVYDPMVTMMGLDDARFNQFGSHTDLTPPVLSFGESAIRLPGALAKAVEGKADYADKQAIRTIPYSNAYLIGDMWNGAASRNN